VSFDLKLEKPPAGYATHAARGGEPLAVRVSGFLTSDDGEMLPTYLEGVSDFLSRIPIESRPPEGRISELLAIIQKDGAMKLYVNELKVICEVQAKGEKNVGDLVYDDDIADIRKARFEGITIPRDAGIAVVMTAGWRKGFLFDYAPFHTGKERAFEVETALGQAYSYLMFRNRLAISEEQWEEIFRQRWFPFISLKKVSLQAMLTRAAQKWSIDELLDDIEAQVTVRCDVLKKFVSSHAMFTQHRQTILKAIEHYDKKDWLSCCHMIYPRLEGVLRTNQAKKMPEGAPTQKGLAESAVHDPDGARHTLSLLLPIRFRAYLELVYFANFDPRQPVEHVGRNTVSHGVVAEDKLDRKAATIGMLILDQLLYLLA